MGEERRHQGQPLLQVELPLPAEVLMADLMRVMTGLLISFSCSPVAGEKRNFTVDRAFHGGPDMGSTATLITIRLVAGIYY